MSYFGVRFIKEEALFYVMGPGGVYERLTDPSQLLFVQRRWASGHREAVRDAPR